jgi:hypothetical protein
MVSVSRRNMLIDFWPGRLEASGIVMDPVIETAKDRVHTLRTIPKILHPEAPDNCNISDASLVRPGAFPSIEQQFERLEQQLADQFAVLQASNINTRILSQNRRSFDGLYRNTLSSLEHV